MNPFTGHSVWTLGTLIWMPILAVIVVGLVGVAAYALYDRERSFAAGALAIAAVFIGLTAAPVIGMYPYDSDFHKWHTVHGTVTQIDKRLIADGKAMSERYVVEVAGRPFAVDDTRAATLRTGDTVTLGCKREWEYAAESGWACRWQGVSR